METKSTEDTGSLPALPSSPPSEREALRAIVDVLVLGEPFLLALWQSSRLSLTQVRVLRSVERGCTSAGGLAQRVGVPPSSLSRILEKLEQRGLVRRDADPADRRRVLIEVTADGRAVLGDLAALATTHLAAAVEAMPEAERTALVAGASGLVRAGRRQHGAVDGTSATRIGDKGEAHGIAGK